MIHFLHTVQHWIHQRPVVYVVWACSVMAAVAVMLSALRVRDRLGSAITQAPIRTPLSLALISLGVAAIGWMDAGGRFPHADIAHATTQTVYVESINAGRTPFSLFAYHSLNLSLSRTPSALALIPETWRPETWSDLRSTRTFTARLVGLPRSLSSALYSSRTGSAGILTALRRLDRLMAHLPRGHVYVSQGMARAYGIREFDTLQLPTAGGVTFWSVSGFVPANLLVGTTSVILPLTRAESLRVADGIDRLVAYSTVDGTARASAVDSVLRRFPLPPRTRVSRPSMVSRSRVYGSVPADWSRRLAIAALLLIILGSIGVSLPVKRRKAPDSDSRARYFNGSEDDRINR